MVTYMTRSVICHFTCVEGAPSEAYHPRNVCWRGVAFFFFAVSTCDAMTRLLLH